MLNVWVCVVSPRHQQCPYSPACPLSVSVECVGVFCQSKAPAVSVQPSLSTESHDDWDDESSALSPRQQTKGPSLLAGSGLLGRQDAVEVSYIPSQSSTKGAIMQLEMCHT